MRGVILYLFDRLRFFKSVSTQYSLSITPENRKLEAFRFQGVQKGKTGLKWISAT